jgi:gliding motility-associated-like protein
LRHLTSPDDAVVSLSWQISDGAGGSSERLVHTFAETGEYTAILIASAPTGCTATTSRKIEVSDLMKAPNVFTPNDDAINDYFTVRTDGINVYTLSVYTRSGVLIYRSQSPEVSWDGRSFAGEPVTPGIYYYTIQRSDIGSKELKGIVYLIR